MAGDLAAVPDQLAQLATAVDALAGAAQACEASLEPRRGRGSGRGLKKEWQGPRLAAYEAAVAHEANEGKP